jgi:DNA-binding MarR family transcriptional regulator
MIMAHLYVVSQADFVFLARKCGLSGGNLSSHTSKLEDSGYIRIEKSFVDKRPQTTFELTRKGRAAFENYRKMMEKALSWGAE